MNKQIIAYFIVCLMCIVGVSHSSAQVLNTGTGTGWGNIPIVLPLLLYDDFTDYDFFHSDADPNSGNSDNTIDGNTGEIIYGYKDIEATKNYIGYDIGAKYSFKQCAFAPEWSTSYAYRDGNDNTVGVSNGFVEISRDYASVIPTVRGYFEVDLSNIYFIEAIQYSHSSTGGAKRGLLVEYSIDNGQLWDTLRYQPGVIWSAGFTKDVNTGVKTANGYRCDPSSYGMLWEDVIYVTSKPFKIRFSEANGQTPRIHDLKVYGMLENSSSVFIAPNGITVKCENCKPGDKGVVNGVEYEVVDRALLEQRLNEGADLTKVCTSLITDMNNMFNTSSFNQDISSWDVSNVTDMQGMFKNALNFNQDLSEWCVTNIGGLPIDFATGCNLDEPYYPVWGTCRAECTAKNTTIEAAICVGDTLEYRGEKLTQSGVYKDTLLTENYCDSIVTLELSISPIYFSNKDTTVFYVSNQEFMDIGSTIILASSDTLESHLGCDSILNSYHKYAYNPIHYTDTVWINDTIWSEEKCIKEVFDTTYVKVVDTIHVSVDDTLIFNYLVADVRINPLTEKTVFKLFPNPAINELNIEIVNDSYVRDYLLKIYSDDGKLMESKVINQNVIKFDVTDYSYGTYLFQLSNDDIIVATKKIIIQ